MFSAGSSEMKREAMLDSLRLELPALDHRNVLRVVLDHGGDLELPVGRERIAGLARAAE